MSGNPFTPQVWAAPQLEYRKGIKPPGVDPTVLPTTVDISCYWLPIVHGACKVLLQESTWDAADETELVKVLGQSQDLLDKFTDAIEKSACNNIQPAIACHTDFTAESGPWVVQRTAGWILGVGWASIASVSGPLFLNGLWITLAFDPIIVTRFEVTLDMVVGDVSGAGATPNEVAMTDGGANVLAFDEPIVSAVTATGRVISATGPGVTANGMSIFWYAQYGTTLAALSQVSITDVKIFGFADHDPCAGE